jgi:NADH dehydrogenase
VKGERIPARTVLWAAGVQAAKISRTLGVELDHAGRVLVAPDLSIPGYPDAFVVGDLVHLDIGKGKLLPGLAPAALQTGRRAARNILADLRGRSRSSFKYHDRGIMATIGRSKAVAQAGALRLAGFTAWLAWLFVHIFYLAGFSKKLAVLTKWAWNYAFSKRGSRLILTDRWRVGSQEKTKETSERLRSA